MLNDKRGSLNVIVINSEKVAAYLCTVTPTETYKRKKPLCPDFLLSSLFSHRYLYSYGDFVAGLKKFFF